MDSRFFPDRVHRIGVSVIETEGYTWAACFPSGCSALRSYVLGLGN